MLAVNEVSPDQLQAEKEKEESASCSGSKTAAGSELDDDYNGKCDKDTEQQKKKMPRSRPDSIFYLERSFCTGGELPVAAARLYNLEVTPVPLPSHLAKTIALVVFWGVCLAFHQAQRALMSDMDLSGRGTEVSFKRHVSGPLQVSINGVLVVLISVYAMLSYVYSKTLLDKVYNAILIPKTWGGQLGVSLAMFTIAIASSWGLTNNWVAAAAGLFMFFGWAVCGRIVQRQASSRGQIGLGPSQWDADEGSSFHIGSWCPDKGQLLACDEESSSEGTNSSTTSPGSGSLRDSCRTTPQVCGKLIAGDAGSRLRFVAVRPDPFTLADDAVVVEMIGQEKGIYKGPCGRANIFRLDVIVILLLSFGMHLPWFVLGGGGYNQCPGIIELVVSLLYIPFGYTCFAAFGFRIALSVRDGVIVILALCLWPFINLVLGGKGCATLTELVVAKTLPQIWNPHATEILFDRGFASCSEFAYGLGGETLLVASTTAAAWVHVMSNFSFLFGFGYGLVKKWRNRLNIEKVVIS
mmetsp:Transcript_45333/g.97191  ORF Transcript_45333/g.97191 Transcript_45333/m.97191 type:complete len:523 (-) Transcript_45333:166-1734(-)